MSSAETGCLFRPSSFSVDSVLIRDKEMDTQLRAKICVCFVLSSIITLSALLPHEETVRQNAGCIRVKRS